MSGCAGFVTFRVPAGCRNGAYGAKTCSCTGFTFVFILVAPGAMSVISYYLGGRRSQLNQPHQRVKRTLAHGSSNAVHSVAICRPQLPHPILVEHICPVRMCKANCNLVHEPDDWNGMGKSVICAVLGVIRGPAVSSSVHFVHSSGSHPYHMKSGMS